MIAAWIAARRRQTLLVLLFVTALASASLPARAAGPFASFGGHWTGSGDITMSDGSREAIRCRANYAVGADGQSLSLRVDCASDSYKVDLLSDVVAQGTNFSGSWQETTRQVQGSITGRIAGPGEMQASLDGVGFGIQLAASTNGRTQSVTIVAQGTDVKRVNITLRKG